MRNLSDYELNAIKAKYTSVGSKLSCAIYARKSKEDKSQQALNVQIETCLAVIEDNKKYLQHRKTYQEDNVSGYSVKGRDEFLALLSAIEDGFIDLVIASKWDRFSRNQAETDQLVKSFNEKGVILIIVDDSGQKDANSELFRRITRSISQYFVERVAEDTKAVLIKKAEQGFSTGGVANYGYQLQRIDKNTILVQDPIEAPIVLEIFEKTFSGYSYQDIIDELEARDVKTRKGNSLTRSSIHDILQNVKYKGTYRYNRADKKRSEIVQKQFEEVLAEDVIEDAIVSKELFDAVQTILDGRKGVKTDSKYLLTGITFCEYCGQQLTGSSQHSSQTKKRRKHYICPNHLPRNGKKCKNKGIDAVTLEEQAKQIVFQYIELFLKNRQRNSKAKDDLIELQIQSYETITKSIKTSIKNYQDSVDKIFERYLETTNEQMKKRLNQSILEKESKIRELKDKLEKTNQTIESFKSFSSSKGKTLTKEKLFSNEDSNRRLIRTIFKRIEVGEKVMFTTI